MIITQKKPLEEVMAMVGDAKTVAVIGCGLCASTCQTGGAPEVEAMKKTLEEAGKTVVVTDVADACCMKLGVRAKCNAISAAAPECIVCMSCGGQKNGKCEVNPENDCAWIQIYKRLEQLGQLDKLSMTRPDKGYEKVAYPRTINQRGKKA